jgi:Icc-related predicted phosphoesterase
MIRVLPGWYGKAEDDLERLIHKIANEQNLDFHVVNDSLTIKNSISNILNTLVHLEDKGCWNLSPEMLAEHKKLEKAMKKKPQKLIASPNNEDSKKKGHSGGSNGTRKN